MRIKHTAINKKALLCILTLIPMLKMGSFSVLFPRVDLAFDILKIFDLLILGFLTYVKFHRGERFVVDRIFSLTLLYSFIVTIVTVVNGGSFFHSIVYCAGLLLVYFWIFLFVRKITNLSGVIVLFSSVMIIDILTKVTYPQGLFTSYTSEGVWMANENWFLGYKNNYFPIIGFAFIVFQHENTAKKNKKISAFAFYTLCFLEIFYVSKSATSLVAAMMIIIYLIFKDMKIFQSNKIIIAYFIINAVVLLAFVVFSGNNKLFLAIGSIFGKDYSVSARFILWRKAIEAFTKSPLFGMGLSAGNVNHPLANWNSHNRYLWSLATVGIVGSLVLLLLVTTLARKIYRNYGKKYNQFLGWILFTIMITWQVEVYENVAMYIYGILVFSYYTIQISGDYSLQGEDSAGSISNGKRTKRKY